MNATSSEDRQGRINLKKKQKKHDESKKRGRQGGGRMSGHSEEAGSRGGKGMRTVLLEGGGFCGTERRTIEPA